MIMIMHQHEQERTPSKASKVIMMPLCHRSNPFIRDMNSIFDSKERDFCIPPLI